MSLSQDHHNMIAQTFHYSRKLLVNSSSPTPQPLPTNFHGGDSPASGSGSTFDANVVMVLSVLLCALICSLGLNSIVRCALRCSSAVASPNTPELRSAAAATGVKKKALRMFPTVVYTSSEQLGIPGLDGDCAICLSEFVAGEKLRLLPKCCHGFHVRCIDKWLDSHSSCPKCRHNLLETCHKIVGTPASFPVSTPAEATVDISPPPAEVVVDILPLEHEGPVRSYRGDNN